MHGLPDQSASLNDDGKAGRGSSRLCMALAGIGVALSTAAGVFSYRALHEPMEALGAAVVNHLAASNCTAIGQILADLAVARGDVLANATPGQRSATERIGVIGVVTPGTWRLEAYRAGAVSEAQATTILQGLPLQTSSPATLQPQTAPDQPLCTPPGFGLSSRTVRVFRIPAPSSIHPGQRHTPEPGNWLAFVHGPFLNNGSQTIAFALVDLQAASVQNSGHAHNIRTLFPKDAGRVHLGLHLSGNDSPGMQKAGGSRPSLVWEDRGLHTSRITPFANQLLRTEIAIDHGGLDRVARRMGISIGLIGLLATTAVVLVSRRAELTLHQLNRKLLQESRTDGLTRVANRRAWDEALSLEESRRQRYNHRYGLVVVDLDGFKRINDHHGHLHGDAVLLRAANALKTVLRQGDLVARVGGDEFALLISNPDSSRLEELVLRLHERLMEAGIQASIGAALSDLRTSLDQTWAQADAAMYLEKSAARA
jgi:diguanylate cyclase (GGDEF)-like protein